MTATLAPITHTSDHRTAFESIDAQLRAWALDEGCDERNFPVLIAGDTLRRAEYPEAFPHLLMSAAVATDPSKPFVRDNAQLVDSFLSPAVCYHAYAQLTGLVLERGVTLTARGHCFRNEYPAALAPGRRQIEFQMRELILVGDANWIERQIEFQMRELILVGDANWIERRLGVLKPGVEALAETLGLSADWQPANDPFFLPRAHGKAHMQRLLGTKIELCLRDGLAVASINRHRTFFGERFHILTRDGAPASSACIAFGLDRWAAHVTPQPAIL